MILEFGFPNANAEVAKPSEVPISRTEFGWKYRDNLNNNFALLVEIPAVFAIFEICLVLDLNTFEPAPKSVTSIEFGLFNSDFRYDSKTLYSG